MILSNLSFLKIGKYEHKNTHMCDFGDIPRPHYCMGLIIKGAGEFAFDDEVVRVEEGDIIFVPKGTTYVSTWSGSSDILYISAHFSFDFPSIFPYGAKLKIQKISSFDFEEMQKLYEEIYAKYEEINDMSFSVLALFYKIMDTVYPKIKYKKTKELDTRIEKAVSYIENHYSEDFSVEYLARLCNMSTSHFHACFKNQLGHSVIEYKNMICIRRAEIMLIENKKSIEEISEELGFGSSIYFRRLFKKHTGKTPREYRKLEEI